MKANGFFGYLDGSISVPSENIRDAQGNETDNPAYNLWGVINSQLLSCLTASLSQNTLPYVLGLQLFNHTKTSSIGIKIDKIKEISQILAAAGSPADMMKNLCIIP